MKKKERAERFQGNLSAGPSTPTPDLIAAAPTQGTPVEVEDAESDDPPLPSTSPDHSAPTHPSYMEVDA